MKNKKTTILVFSLIFFFLLLSVFGIKNCIIRFVFGLCCPACGITRAIINALQFNFSKSFYYHLFWPVVVMGFMVYILIEFKILKISKKKLLSYAYIITFLNLIYYFYRLFGKSSVVYFDFTESLIYKIITMFK